MRIRILPLLTLLLLTLCISGCDVEYWWSRGKPPTSEKLLTLSHSKLQQSFLTTSRAEIKPEFLELEKLLTETRLGLTQGVAGDKLKSNLSSIRQGMYGLEGKLSFGSRPAYGELLSQLRGFEDIARENGNVDTNVFTLYSARVFFFLSDELGVPAPIGSYS